MSVLEALRAYTTALLERRSEESIATAIAGLVEAISPTPAATPVDPVLPADPPAASSIFP
jgi:hypothetical protein